MDNKQEHLQALTDIRSMMERSSRFISLSGLSGVFAGIFALVGVYLAHLKIKNLYSNFYNRVDNDLIFDTMVYLITVAVSVLFCSLLVGVILTVRNSKKRGISIWDGTSKRLLINLAIPLASGGLFCLLLLHHGIGWLVGPVTLIFYGLALINASKYTFNDIRYLGVMEILLGLFSTYYVGYGLICWAIGFGVLHIVYGAVMYFKYERKN